MKKVQLLLLLGSIFFSHVYAFEERFSPKAGGKKIYVNASDIAFEGSNIWVRFEKDWNQVRALNTDERGIFVTALKLPFGYWSCRDCGYVNRPTRIQCQNPEGCSGTR